MAWYTGIGSTGPYSGQTPLQYPLGSRQPQQASQGQSAAPQIMAMPMMNAPSTSTPSPLGGGSLGGGGTTPAPAAPAAPAPPAAPGARPTARFNADPNNHPINQMQFKNHSDYLAYEEEQRKKLLAKARLAAGPTPQELEQMRAEAAARASQPGTMPYGGVGGSSGFFPGPNGQYFPTK